MVISPPPPLSALITLIHFTALGLLALYGLHRIWLLCCWWRLRRTATPQRPGPLPLKLPLVTVQLPLFNERFVVERLLDAAARLDWPADRLEIQVLDDSTDDTMAMAARRVAHWQSRGVAIHHLHRRQRSGYKAGAMAAGLVKAKGELIAIFDADFIPPADFLLRTVAEFESAEVGMVQTRWGFCNADHSWLTRVQRLLLGPHFTIEHQVRYRRGLFFNFNGTAGIWRRQAITGAGGWQADTVTEDLDLSYRSQLAGWRFVYLDGYEVPSELPATLAALRSQQQRWAKGSIQTARKILPRLLAADLPVAVKAEALAHLLANGCWLLGTIVLLTLYPTVIARSGVGPWQLLRLDLPLFLASTGAILLYFWAYLRTRSYRESPWRLLVLPVLSIGLAPSIALALVRGLWSRGGVFERTPKFGIASQDRLPPLAFLYQQREFHYLCLNLLLCGYSLLPLWFAWQRQIWYALPLFLLFPAGFLLVIGQQLQELWSAGRQRLAVNAPPHATPTLASNDTSP